MRWPTHYVNIKILKNYLIRRNIFDKKNDIRIHSKRFKKFNTMKLIKTNLIYSCQKYAKFIQHADNIFKHERIMDSYQYQNILQRRDRACICGRCDTLNENYDRITQCKIENEIDPCHEIKVNEWIDHLGKLTPQCYPNVCPQLLLDTHQKQLAFHNKIIKVLSSNNFGSDTYIKWVQDYLLFLGLCATHPKEKIRPTMIQDFVWHAHMMDHQSYVMIQPIFLPQS